MRGTWWCGVVVVVGGCLISPVMQFGGNGKSARENQRAMMQSNFAPSQLVIEHTWSGDISTVQIRVYADDDYRQQNIHWEKHFAETLDQTNEVLGAAFGIHLEAKYLPWKHHAPDKRLDEALAELVALDPGTGVSNVIGLTSSLSLAAATFEELGYAAVDGKHLVMRGYANLAERKEFERAFPEIPKDELDEHVDARRRHKLATVFLHELGHNYGAQHELDSETIMNGSYSPHAAAFAPASRATIIHTLDERLGRNSAQANSVSATTSSTHPTPAAAAPVQHVKVTVYLTTNGTTIVDKRVLGPAALDELLQTTFENDPDAEIAIVKDRSVSNGALVGLTERVKHTGLHTITISYR